MVLSANSTDLQENLCIIRDPETGVSGAIAIHSTVLGPAVGGCRLWRYSSEYDMISDAMRLARGMSFKNAMAGLPFGGGKAVLQHPKGKFDREAMFRVFAQAVEELRGQYVTAKDVGTSMEDMKLVNGYTRYVGGLEPKPGKAGGNPSPWTALGVFESMQVAVRFALGQDLHGLTVAVQGTGSVGAELCRLLAQAGAKLVVADIDGVRAEKVARRYDARIVGVEEIAAVRSDVFAPCALGAVLDGGSIAALQAKVVCGAANNQLAIDSDGSQLASRKIVYAPDYVVNAGGLISVTAEYLGETTESVEQRVRQIGARLQTVLTQARMKRRATNIVADDIARELIFARARKFA